MGNRMRADETSILFWNGAARPLRYFLLPKVTVCNLKLQNVLLQLVLHRLRLDIRPFAPVRRGPPENAFRHPPTKFPFSPKTRKNRYHFSSIFLKMFVREVHISLMIKASTNSYKQFPHSFQHRGNRGFATVTVRFGKDWNPPDRDFNHVKIRGRC